MDHPKRVNVFLERKGNHSRSRGRGETGEFEEMRFDGWMSALGARLASAMLFVAAATAVPTDAEAQLLVNKSFSPANVAPAEQSTLTIQVLNNTATPATDVNITDAFPTSPTGMRIAVAGATSNTCGGTVTAALNGTTVTLTGGSLPAASAGVAGSCSFTVMVNALPAMSGSSTTYVNVIPMANVSSSIGSTTTSSSATLSVAPTLPLNGKITFSQSVVKGDGAPSRARYTINNPNGYAVTGLSLSDGLPTQLIKAPNPNMTTTCGSAVLGTATTSVTMTGGSIPANGSCYIEVDIVARNPASATNGDVTISVAANNLVTDQKVTNTASIWGNIDIQTGAGLSKSFGSSSVVAGQATTVTVTVANYRAIPLGPFSITDNLPSGMTASGTGTTTCQGASVDVTSAAVTLVGANLPAASATARGGTSCTFTFTVTASTDGTFVNTIPAGTIAGSNHGTASATLTTTGIRGTMTFSPDSIPRTGNTTMKIIFYNRSTSVAVMEPFTNVIGSMGSGILVGGGVTSSDCGGTPEVSSDGTTVTLVGGSIPAMSGTTEGRCELTVTLKATNQAATGNRRNTVAAGAIKTDLGSNTTAFSDTLSVGSAVGLSKSFSPATVVTGGQSRITVNVNRAARADFVSDMAFTDNLPNGMVIAADPNATTTCTNATLTAVAGATSFSMSGAISGTNQLTASTCTVSVNVKAPSNVGTFTNTIPAGGLTANTRYYGPVSNTSSASATLSTITAVTLNTAFSPTTILPKETSRLSVYISNPVAAGALSGVSLVDNLPSGLVLTQSPNATLTSSSGTCAGTIQAAPGTGVIRITGGTVSAGAMCELSFDVTTESIGTLTNALPPGALTSSEGFTNANTASATLVSSGTADISITKTNGTTSQTAGRTTVYTIVVTNNSTTLSVNGLPVKDPSQSGLTTQSWTCSATSGSRCSAATGTQDIDATVDLQPNGKATFQLTMLLAPDWTGSSVVNRASVQPSATGVNDPDPSNDATEDVDTVTRSADLSVTKTASTNVLKPGDQIVFSVKATNQGPSTAVDVVVTDALPSGYDLVSTSAEQGTFSGSVWTIGAMHVQQSVTLTIVARARSGGVRRNTATISSGTPDPNAENDTSSVTPNVIGLSFSKRVVTLSDPINGTAAPKAIPGAFVAYHMTVSNHTDGTIDADTIVVSDSLPSQVAAYVLSDAVIITQGTVQSGLDVVSTDVSWSSQPGGGAPYSYVPVPDSNGCDPRVTGIRIRTKGSMAPGTETSPSSITIGIRARIL